MIVSTTLQRYEWVRVQFPDRALNIDSNGNHFDDEWVKPVYGDVPPKASVTFDGAGDGSLTIQLPDGRKLFVFANGATFVALDVVTLAGQRGAVVEGCPRTV